MFPLIIYERTFIIYELSKLIVESRDLAAHTAFLCCVYYLVCVEENLPRWRPGLMAPGINSPHFRPSGHPTVPVCLAIFPINLSVLPLSPHVFRRLNGTFINNFGQSLVHHLPLVNNMMSSSVHIKLNEE